MASRKVDMQRIIDEQKGKIDKYEQKLRDVISAYKSLAAEKSALEESMKALNTSANFNESQQEITENQKESPENNTMGSEEKANNHNEDDAIERASVGSSVDTSFSENASSVDALAKSATNLPSDSGSKIAVLRRALATITEEKSRQEKAFTADRKNLLQEITTLKEELKGQQTEMAKTEAVFKQQLQETKANLRQLQCERDCEQTDHAAMLREMQEKLNQARVQCESYQNRIMTLSTDLKKKEQEPEESRRLIEQLLEENGRLKDKLDEAEKKLAEMPQASRMQMELTQIKAQHAAAIKEEQARSSNATTELNRFKEHSESQIAGLEDKLSELTSTVSEYERLRRQDSETIQKLTSRVNELDQENTTLAKVTACRNCVEHKDESVPSLLEKTKRLFSELRRRADVIDCTGSQIDFYDALGLENPHSEQAHSKCRSDFESLKDEFEKYKLRAQAALKNKNLMKDTVSNEKNEVEQLRRIVSELQRSLADSQHQCEASESTCIDLRRSIAQLKEDHKRELADLQNQSKQHISDIEAESSKQRERTLEVLTEKEKELDTMRVIMRAVRSVSPYGQSSSENTNSISNRKPSFAAATRSTVRHSTSSQQEISAPAGAIVESRGSTESINSAGYDMHAGSPVDGDPTSVPNVPSMHLSQELARREKLIEQLRRDIRQLETAMRQVERSSLTKELQHYDTIEKLKEEIRSLESKLSRYQINGENFEYLKNVLVQYMLCDDATGKAHMLKAIGRALHLSAKELELIQKHNARFYSWWPGGKSK